LKNDGILTFIAQNNWTTSYGASVLRHKVIKETQVLKLIDFGDYKVFENAGIQTMIMIFRKSFTYNEYSFDYRRITNKSPSSADLNNILNHVDTPNIIYIQPSIQRNKYMNSVLTFSTDSYSEVLDKINNSSNFRLDPQKEVAQGIVYPQDKVNTASMRKLNNSVSVGDGIFVINEDEISSMNLSEQENLLLKPVYTTNELHRWYGDKKATQWLIYTDSKFKDKKSMDLYPTIKKHLDKYAKVITSDNAPYGLHRSRDEYFFKGEKIISLRKCLTPTFTYVDFDSYVSATFYVVKTTRVNMKYLTGVLNSKLIRFWLKYKGKMQGNNYQIDKEPLIGLPLIVPTQDVQNNIANMVNQILQQYANEEVASTRDIKLKNIEAELNKAIYTLYKLSEADISVIEGSL